MIDPRRMRTLYQASDKAVVAMVKEAELKGVSVPESLAKHMLSMGIDALTHGTGPLTEEESTEVGFYLQRGPSPFIKE